MLISEKLVYQLSLYLLSIYQQFVVEMLFLVYVAASFLVLTVF